VKQEDKDSEHHSEKQVAWMKVVAGMTKEALLASQTECADSGLVILHGCRVPSCLPISLGGQL
jgi:hypothetical protein